MEQRVSGLQARLEARRNMFLKTDNNGTNNATYGVNNGNKPANSTSSGRTKKSYIKIKRLNRPKLI